MKNGKWKQQRKEGECGEKHEQGYEIWNNKERKRETTKQSELIMECEINVVNVDYQEYFLINAFHPFNLNL